MAVPGQNTNQRFFILPRAREDNYSTELNEVVKDFIFEGVGFVKHLSKIKVDDEVELFLDPHYYYFPMPQKIIIVVEHNGFYRKVPVHTDMNLRRYSLCRLWTSNLFPGDDAMFAKVYHNEVVELNRI